MYWPISSDPVSIAAFLAHHPPFDGLEPDELASVAQVAVARSYRAGEPALIEDGEPSHALYVVLDGAMELAHGEHMVDVLEPGQCFGHPSLLAGMAPAFTVRARIDTTCLLLPQEVALGVLAHPAGLRYLARSLRHRLVSTGHVAHALPQLSMTRLSTLVDEAPLFLPLDATVRDAAEAMTAHRVSAALVETRDGIGIVADGDLREQVLARGYGPDEGVMTAVRLPALCVPGDRTVSEVLMELLDGEQRELCVTDPGGRIVGLLSVEDLASGQHSPFALRRALAHAPDEASLVAAASAGLPRLLASLLSAGLRPADVTRALTTQSDAATTRLIELALDRHGPAPVPWAWMALGSVARREMTLASDQDNAFAYADDGSPDVDDYFARLTADVNDGLERCGLGEDNAEVLARNPLWRMPIGRWADVFRACLDFPDSSHLVRASVAFDFRQVAGSLDVVAPLTEIVREARHHRPFIARLARTATDCTIPLGRRGRLALDRDGRIDLKTGGALPIANIARLHALAAGITISGTVDRLVAAEETGRLDGETAAALREAFAAVSRIRLEHHAACAAAGQPADNRIDPHVLPPLRRLGLREALRAVAAAQRRLSIYLPLGT